jgi:hypothetical protein
METFRNLSKRGGDTMSPTKQELEARIASLEDALEEARDLIDEVLGVEQGDEVDDN